MRQKVVIVGGGFGGLTCAQSLARAPVDVVLVDRTNHHLFQPLLYQVAMAGLSPADIASPIRSVLSRQENARVLLGEVTRVDLAGRRVVLQEGELAYDWLVLATGAETSYFGHHEWEGIAPGLKSLEDAVRIRQQVLLSFEIAERIDDEKERERLLSFVVIGGGPTGVELAGALAELSRFVLARDFRAIRPDSARILLLEGGSRILASFPEELSARATEQLEELGVHVRTGATVTRIERDGVWLGGEHLPASVVIWAAGVRATPITGTLGVDIDRAGRVPVLPDLTIKGHPDAFVIGDAALVLDARGQPLPGVSPVAMQEARTVARSIALGIDGKPRVSFHYFDKGSMATIGRSRAIAQMGRIRLSGFLAWLAWLTVHLWYLIGFRNRFVVMFTWFWSYVTYRRGARLITDRRHELELDGGATVSSRGRAQRAQAPSGEPAPQAARQDRA
jgi:NADH:quinone reductase (non-electrogenic)